MATPPLAQRRLVVEGLARVDVLCLDKAGTLTYGDILFDSLQLFPGADGADVRDALALLTRIGDANATVDALRAEFSNTMWQQVDTVPFSSARKWSAVTAADHGTWILGAPEMVLYAPGDASQVAARARADVVAAAGSRVLLLAVTHAGDRISHDAALPVDLAPAALVLLAEHIRDDAETTLRYFTEQGVVIKVLSGDNPRTVVRSLLRYTCPESNGPATRSTPAPCPRTSTISLPSSRPTTCSAASVRTRNAR